MDINDISEKWRDENQHIKQMSQPISADDYELQCTQRFLSTQFKVLSFMTQTQHHLDKLYKDPQQFPFNRHSHILTFQPTRVIIGEQDKKQLPENYINANLITIQGRKLIACQAPMTTTFLNFWRMIEQYQVQNIFMLCQRLQRGRVQCDIYWGHDDITQTPTTINNYVVNLIQKTKNGNIVRRKIRLYNKLTNTERIIYHNQLLNWVDGDKPSQAIMTQLNQLIDQNISQIKSNKITLVHCSAGVGRTGTFIAMSELKMQIIESNKPVTIFQNVRKLKEQRWGLVFTETQYKYLYDYVKDQLLKDQHEQYDNQ